MRRQDPFELEQRTSKQTLKRDTWLARGIVAAILFVTIGTCAFWIWYPKKQGEVLVATLPYLANCEDEACEARVMNAHRECRKGTEVPQTFSKERRTPYDFCMQNELR